MFVALRPLTDYNGLVGNALAIRYMRDSGEPVKPPAGSMSQLVADFRDNSLTLRRAAGLLRSWAISGPI